MTNKRSLVQLWAQLGAAGHDAAAVWGAVQRVVALSLAAMQPPIAHSYTTAFVTGGPAARPAASDAPGNLDPEEAEEADAAVAPPGEAA